MASKEGGLFTNSGSKELLRRRRIGTAKQKHNSYNY